MLGALGQQAVEQHLVETVRAGQRVGDALHGSWLKSRPVVPKARSKSAMTTLAFKISDSVQADVVADGRRADAALGADEGDRRDRRGSRLGIVVEIGDRSPSAASARSAHQIFADAALQQLAIEHDVVDVADDEHLGARVADLGQPIELGRGSGRAADCISTMMRFGVGFS